ncbi:MAG: hypothetical protein JNM10_09105 [Planctomycetia bacterium]|nr:hypothetical protein [Planctomycetia bacterium]
MHATWRQQDEFLVGGLWRLDLEREAALRLLSAHDGDAAWPLTKPEKGRGFDLLWRPRLERWYLAQPVGEAAKNLRAKLAESWREAVASKDARLAETVVDAMDERLGREPGEALASEARGLIRETISVLEACVRARPGCVFSYDLPVGLMERFGVPEQVVLKPFVDGTRHRAAELAGEPIPFPHPYDLDLLILRLERLPDRPR